MFCSAPGIAAAAGGASLSSSLSTVASRFDAVVLGCGLWGASIAYHMLKSTNAAFQRIAVIEPCEQPFAGATSRSAGLLLRAPIFKEKDICVQDTFADISDLQRDLGEDLQWHDAGTLRVCLRGTSDFSSFGGMEVSANDVQFLVPWLSQLPREAKASLMEGGDGSIDPSVLAGAYLRQSQASGATLICGTAATDIVIDGSGCVNGVLAKSVKASAGSDAQMISAPVVIDATGSAAGLLGHRSGLPRLGYAPVRSHYYHCKGDPRMFLSTSPNVLCPDARAFTRVDRSTPGGVIVGVQEEKSKTWDAASLPWPSEQAHAVADVQCDDAENSLFESYGALLPHAPTLENLEIGTYTGGLSTYTPDGGYICGKSPGNEISGLIVASGCNGSGLSAAGGIGRLVARIAAGIETDEQLVRRFDPSRFDFDSLGDPASSSFREACAASRSSKLATVSAPSLCE